VPDAPPTMMPMNEPMRRAAHGILATLRAETPAHEDLRSRIVGLTMFSVLADLVCGGLAWWFEHGKGEITTFWNALFWTTTQMLTISSQFPNPLTTGGKLLDVVIQLYAIVVVTSMAGTFASFFHRRSRERAAAKQKTS
jgi:hypothetical protein